MKIKDETHKLDAKNFTLIANEILNITSDVQIILRGHICCESTLARLVNKLSPNPEYLNNKLSNFSGYLTIAAVSGFIGRPTYNILLYFTKIRNNAAHKLNYNIGKVESQNFQNTIKGAFGDSETYSFIGDAANWYFQDCDSTTIQLRRCVFFIWATLELDYSIRCIGFQVGKAINDLNHCASIESPTSNLELRRGVELLKRLFPISDTAVEWLSSIKKIK